MSVRSHRGFTAPAHTCRLKPTVHVQLLGLLLDHRVATTGGTGTFDHPLNHLQTTVSKRSDRAGRRPAAIPSDCSDDLDLLTELRSCGANLVDDISAEDLFGAILSPAWSGPLSAHDPIALNQLAGIVRGVDRFD